MTSTAPAADLELCAQAEGLGFTDASFDARYSGKPSRAEDATDPSQAAKPAAIAPAAPRSRNSYMRARARRLAAPSG
jgi:hypothetical protein